jgi:outer membrane protein TolC
VLDAERSANRAREQLVIARGELADAQLALFRAIGGDFGPGLPEAADRNPLSLR